MIPAAEVARSLYGAYRLARFDPRGGDFFNKTEDGFWRSFFAAVIVAPIYGVFLLARYATGDVSAPAFRFITIEIIAYVISWILYPVLMATVARYLDRENRYMEYIIAYNWAGVLQNALFLPIAMLQMTGGPAAEATKLLSLIALGYILAYVWFISRTVLHIPALTAAGLVILDMMLSVLLNAVTDSML